MTTVTINAQQALNSTQAAVSQATSTTTAVAATTSNVLITTQAYASAAGVSQTFAYQNPLIGTTSSGILISATITSYIGTGNPILTLSGQTTGTVFITITNAHPTLALNAALTIAVLVYPSIT